MKRRTLGVWTKLAGAVALLLPVFALACSSDDDGGSDFSSGGAAAGGGSGSGGSAAGTGTGGFGALGGSSAGGSNAGGSNAGGSSGTTGCGSNLTGTIRDFTDEHPDFEYEIRDDRGIVAAELGPDKKPVYAGNPDTPTTNGQASFDQWYRDVPGVNQGMPFTLNFVNSGNGVYTFENNEFFPIDDQLLGNQGRNHNYHFTFELHTTFVYNGGETFRFRGDDDVWIFINGKLAVDLGGVHGAQEAQIALDEHADEWGLQVGQVYPLDGFFAERHTTQSNFRIDTSIVFVDCGGPIT